MVKKQKQVRFKDSDFAKINTCVLGTCPEIAKKGGMVAIRNSKSKKAITVFSSEEAKVLGQELLQIEKDSL